MLTQDSTAILGDAERIFEISAIGANVGRALQSGRQVNRRWRIATRASDKARFAKVYPNDAVINAVDNVAVGHAGEVSDGGEFLPRLFIFETLRLA